MTRPLLRPVPLLLALATLIAAPAADLVAVEGKWTPEQVLRLDPAWLASLGLEMPPGALWTPGEGGLLEATIDVGGCSGAFISADGLLVTNHHCAFNLIQQHSTPENDRLANGFLAAGREGELAGEGTRVRVPHAFTDVSARVEATIPAGADDLARYRAVESAKKALIAECEAKPFRRCEVATYDDGVAHALVENLEFPDVRLVWAPPWSVGDFGGEVDNWMWPRHGGDVAFLRVWAGPDNAPANASTENRPYRPRRHFAMSTEGVSPGSFVMVTGYPGRSFRRLTASEAAERAELYFPRRAELLGAWMAMLERASEAGKAEALALAPAIKTLGNGEKNARGQVAGIARGSILEKKRALESEVLAWVKSHPEHAAAAASHQGLDALAAEKRARFERDFLLENADRGSVALKWALGLVRWAAERGKPDMERDPDYMERNRQRARERMRTEEKRFDRGGDTALLADLLHRLAAAGSPAAKTALGEGDPAAAAAALLKATVVTDTATRLAMFDEDHGTLAARPDPLLKLALALDEERREREERADRWAGTAMRLRPAWLAAVAAWQGSPLAPDANGTLRVSFANVKGYVPRDGVWYEPQTRVAGVVEKHTGEHPFNAPAAVLMAAAKAAQSRWADARLGDVPVDFLADADTTGGNSGSPVIDGRGRLVGVNFDRVWENVANDFGYNPVIARNVSVDVRYVLWLLEVLHADAAGALLGELGIPPTR